MSNDEETRKQAISNVETEYQEINSQGAWPMIYQHIRNVSGTYNYTCNESKKPQNKNFNRYRDVAPYDHSRIILKRGVCDYIHANLVRMERANRQYILTQGPLPSTAGHFWLMIWEQNSKAVLMLNKVIEKNQLKCHQYWPLENSPAPDMIFADVNIKVEYVSKTESSDYTISTLRLVDLENNDSKEILHFHYTTWPDFGVPQCPMAFLRFLADVRQSGSLDQNVGPPVVHCSAGIGRSGTFCLVDTCLVLIEENGLNAVNVRDVLLEMRRSRMGLIQTPDQLRFSYAAIIEGAKRLPLSNETISLMLAQNDNDEVITNRYDSVNNSLSEKDDEPPPLPPPRGESLTRSMMSDLNTDESNGDDECGGPPDKPLPSEPPINIEPCTTTPSSATTSIEQSPIYNKDTYHQSIDISSNASSDNVENSSSTNSSSTSPEMLRRRREERAEKNERLTTQVREMKRRQQETEKWQSFKRSLCKPLTIGIGIGIGGGIIVLCGYYLYMRS